MKFDLTKVVKKALQNAVNNTLYRGKPINDWINFIANNADDLISRQAAIDFIKDHSYPVRYDRTSIEQGMTLTGIEQALNELPSVQPEQKTGRWLVSSNGYYPYCSNCRMEPQGRLMTDFCPNCGAKMGIKIERTIKT